MPTSWTASAGFSRDNIPSLPFCQSKGAVYLKNSIFKYWREADPGDTDADATAYSEQAKTIVRENIVNAII